MNFPKIAIEYTINVLKYFGLAAPSIEEFKEATQDQGGKTVTKKFIILIYEFSLLHIGGFKFKLTKIERDYKSIERRLEDIQKFTIHYLFNIKCPFLVVMNGKIHLKTSSNRTLLLLFGWLIYKTDLFDMYLDSLLSEAQQFFSKTIVYNPTFQDEPFDPLKTKEMIKDDLNDIITGYKKVKHLYLNLVKLTAYESKLEAKTKKSIASSHEGITFEEYYFLKDPKNLEILEEGLEDLKTKLDYEVAHMKQREVFWEWLENVVVLDEKSVGNDPDKKMKDDVPEEELQILDKSAVMQLEKLRKDLVEVRKMYSKHKTAIEQFRDLCDTETQKLNMKEYAKLRKQLMSMLVYVNEELEQKYPSLDKMRSGANRLDVFYGEVALHLQDLFVENSEESSCEVQTLTNQIVKMKKESELFKEEINEALQEFAKLLPEEIKLIQT